ncbi:divalent metal cation transporter [Micromonospora sp. WMMD975]|nr:divalent metal cation transporter [Micromonospora sp. WMMD975]WFE36694.1 divalent metal cation transporter [Micromonospora sp. WMMD975]
MLVQTLTAKLGLATGRSLPELCRERLPKPLDRTMWVQAELVAMANLAEVIGGAVARYLLFGIPLLPGGIIIGPPRSPCSRSARGASAPLRSPSPRGSASSSGPPGEPARRRLRSGLRRGRPGARVPGQVTTVQESPAMPPSAASRGRHCRCVVCGCGQVRVDHCWLVPPWQAQRWILVPLAVP